MKVGIVREIAAGERRVAGSLTTVERLHKLGVDEVLVEAGAGAAAGISDAEYSGVGARIVFRDDLFNEADVIFKVREPMATADGHEADLFREGQTLISFIWPGQNEELVERLRARGVTTIAMDKVPRISRAQKLDALSSMANLAGYRAVVEAASELGRFFTGQITAAGKIPPTKVLVIGAGVAGLAAIGAARALGAVVRAFDTRPVVKEQVESMGAEFLELEFEEDGTGEGGYAKVMSQAFIDAEMALFAEQAEEVNVIITTALIPGRPAPKLIDADMVASMKPGSVIVDLAAEQGGNCARTVPGELFVTENGVKVVGYTDLAGRMSVQASQLYGMNLCHMLDEMGGGEEFTVDLENEVVRGSLVTHEGEVMWPAPKIADPSPQRKPSSTQSLTAGGGGHGHDVEPMSSEKSAAMLGITGAVLLFIGLTAPPSFLTHFTVFVLAIFIGWQVIWNVSPALHTPLMSVTNAISGIIIVAGMLQISGPPVAAATILGAIAILIASINIAGGFLVTQRMLQMFRR